jgi:rRNA maturation protein Nop10
MPKLECPHCGERAVSSRTMWGCWFLKPETCPACGKEVGVSFIAGFLANAPWIAGLFCATLIEPFILKGALFVSGWVVSVIIMGYWVPLKPR